MALALQSQSHSTQSQWAADPGSGNSASVETGENWAGLGDPKERRKIQNRINQRAFREFFHLDARCMRPF
jgi:hypothetical protein